MNTPSHAIITLALRRALPRLRMPLSAVAWGSVAPDIPLFLLTLGGAFYFHVLHGWPLRAALDWMLGTLYLRNPVWLAARSTLHAPLIIAALLGLARTIGHGRAWGRWLEWFAAACALHALLDMLTHVNDGPLLLFPFSWSVRFHSPVSYWDPRFHGHAFAVFELGLDVVLLAYLVLGWRGSRGVRADSRQVTRTVL